MSCNEMIPNTPTCIWVLGMPASGKSYICEQLATLLTIPIVDSDVYLTARMNDLGIPLNFSIHSTRDERRMIDIRRYAIDCMFQESRLLSERRETFIYTGTGKDWAAVNKSVLKMQRNGYRTCIVYVAVDIEEARRRNALRDRKVPAFLIDAFESYPSNFFENKYIEMVGEKNFFLIDNTQPQENLIGVLTEWRSNLLNNS